MVARVRLVKPHYTDTASGDLFAEISTGSDGSSQPVGLVTEGSESEIPRRSGPLDDESQLLDVEQLYPASRELNTQLSTALGILQLASLRVERGLDALRAGNPLDADDEVVHLLVALEELFSQRELGEGFANVASACLAAVQNSRGQAFNEAKWIALNSALRSLRRKPFMTFETSMEIAERLEGAGLEIGADGIDPIQDWLVSGGVR